MQQRVIMFAVRRSDHITPLLHSLHWLRTEESLNESHSGLRYLRTGTSMVQRQSTWHLCCSAFPTYILASDFALHGILTWWCHGQFAPPSVNGLSSCIHVECFTSFCPFVQISVPVQKSTQDRTMRAFIRAILLNLSLRHRDSTFLFRDLESLWIYVTLMTILILTN